LAGRLNWCENLGSIRTDGTKHGSSWRFCLLSEVKDRLWIVYWRDVFVWRVVSATSLNPAIDKTYNKCG